MDDVPEIERDTPVVLVSSQSTPTATDSDRWPEVFAAPSGPVAAASAVFADRLLRRAAASLPMRVAYPDGTVIGAGDASSPMLTVNDPDRLARQRIAAAGKSDRVRIDVCDYRDIDGEYDAVISVEMVEAVGHRSWPDLLRTLGRLVKPGGHVVIQAIAMPHAHMLATRNSQTWIQKYIFPGGQIPSAKALLAITQRDSTLRLFDMNSLGDHYAETLRLWRERFIQRRKMLSHIVFDDVFARMWELYLADREAGFRSGNLNIYQWTFVNQAPP